MRLLGVIPARLHANRLPRKPLQRVAGRTLVHHVFRRLESFALCDEIVVATDATEVVEALSAEGLRVTLTSSDHASGTERISELIQKKEFRSFDFMLNVQCDELFVPRAAVAGAVARIESGDPIGTASGPLSQDGAQNPHCVKVVTDVNGHALYFSRSPIPHVAPDSDVRTLHRQHLGIYAYRREALEQWVRWEPVPAERAERLEQLRPLYYGMKIGVSPVEQPVHRGIDTPEDLAWAAAEFQSIMAEG